MGIKEEVVSPTFNLELVYQLPSLPVAQFSHIDAWRMQSGEELEQLGLRGLVNDKSVIAIEWADRVADVIRKYDEEAVVVWVNIAYGTGENEREISWRVV